MSPHLLSLWLLACAFLSGLAGLVYEVVWLREVGLRFGNTLSATGTVLAVFMAGMALGSVWLGQRADRTERPLGLYAGLEVGIGLSALLVPAGLRLIDHAGLLLFPNFLGLVVPLSVLVLLVPAVGLGGTLPVLARCLPSILPRMAPQEALEVTKIYSVNGSLQSENPLMLQRPFRSPHYTISNAGLVGGGRSLRPGEITLSHRGVLFLDELPEFNHAALESLRQPLEDKVVTISRVAGSVTYPASFMMVAAMNPCPCGFYNHPVKECTCSPSTVARYQKKISGPLMDRVDVFVEVPPVEYDKLVESSDGEGSSGPRQRVEQAREWQRDRFKENGFLCNSEMGPAEVWQYCEMEDAARSLLQSAAQRLTLSARAFHRVLKVSRTIADLDGAEIIGVSHLAEALQYRARAAIG